MGCMIIKILTLMTKFSKLILVLIYIDKEILLLIHMILNIKKDLMYKNY